jgi:phosphoglycolate phosphatase-like HAD superfamily hydrolase
MTQLRAFIFDVDGTLAELASSFGEEAVGWFEVIAVGDATMFDVALGERLLAA